MRKNNKTQPRQSWTFDEYTNSEIRRAAALLISEFVYSSKVQDCRG